LRIKEGSILYKITPIENKIELIKKALLLSNAYVSLKPAVVTVRSQSGKLNIAIPPFTLISDEAIEGEEFDYILATDAWIESKPLISSSHIQTLGDGPLTSLLEELFPLVKVKPGKKCIIIDEKAGLDLEIYLKKYLNTKHICLLKGVSGVNVETLEGTVRFYWSTHPLLSGIKPSPSKIKLRSGIIDSVRKIKLLIVAAPGGRRLTRWFKILWSI